MATSTPTATAPIEAARIATAGRATRFKDNDYQIGARAATKTPSAARASTCAVIARGTRPATTTATTDRAGQYGQLYGRPADGCRREPARDVVCRPPAQFQRIWRSTPAIVTASRPVSRITGATRARTSATPTPTERRSWLPRELRRPGRVPAAVPGRLRARISRTATGGRSTRPTAAATSRHSGSRRVPADTPDARRTRPSGSFIVPANRQWTPTGIRVNQDDLLRFDGDRRDPLHAECQRSRRSRRARWPTDYVSGAPLPAAFAGALIGRIDNGQPFGIGDQTSLRMPASGLLVPRRQRRQRQRQQRPVPGRHLVEVGLTPARSCRARGRRCRRGSARSARRCSRGGSAPRSDRRRASSD